MSFQSHHDPPLTNALPEDLVWVRCTAVHSLREQHSGSIFLMWQRSPASSGTPSCAASSYGHGSSFPGFFTGGPGVCSGLVRPGLPFGAVGQPGNNTLDEVAALPVRFPLASRYRGAFRQDSSAWAADAVRRLMADPACKVALARCSGAWRVAHFYAGCGAVHQGCRTFFSAQVAQRVGRSRLSTRSET